jgi:hypothetical protein
LSGGRRARRFFIGLRALKAKTAEDRALLELIEPVAESLGLDIVRVRLMKNCASSVSAAAMSMNLEGEEDTALSPFDCLVDAKLVLTDELMKAGAEKRAARNDNSVETED